MDRTLARSTFFNDVFIAYFYMVFVYAASVYAYKKKNVNIPLVILYEN